METFSKFRHTKLILFILILESYALASGSINHDIITHEELDFVHDNLEFFTTPAIHQIDQNPDLLIKASEVEESSPLDTQGVIYSIGIGDVESLISQKKEQKCTEKNELRMFARNLLRASCKALKAKLSCNIDAKERRFKKAEAKREYTAEILLELPSKTQELNLYRNVDKPIKKSIKKMKMKWIHKAQMTADMIYEDLILNRFRHVFIVAHASSDGLLFDTNQNEIEPSLFRRFGAHLQSLTLFSCYSDKVEARYKWSPDLASLYKQRFFMNLPVSEELGSFSINRGNHSVLNKFLKNVDKFIYRNIDHNNLIPEQKKYHRLEFLGFQSQAMAYSVKLNGLHVGVVSSPKNIVFIKPENLKNGRNALILGCLNINPMEKSQLGKTEQSFEIFLDGEAISNKFSDVTYKHLGFVDNGELYRNSKISFILQNNS